MQLNKLDDCDILGNDLVVCSHIPTLLDGLVACFDTLLVVSLLEVDGYLVRAKSRSRSMEATLTGEIGQVRDILGIELPCLGIVFDSLLELPSLVCSVSLCFECVGFLLGLGIWVIDFHRFLFWFLLGLWLLWCGFRFGGRWCRLRAGVLGRGPWLHSRWHFVRSLRPLHCVLYVSTHPHSSRLLRTYDINAHHNT